MRVLGIAVVCFLIGCGPNGKSHPSDRSWQRGTVTITLRWDSEGLHHLVDAHWPDASPGLQVRYWDGLVQEGRPDVLIAAAEGEADPRDGIGLQLQFLTPQTGSLGKVDPSRPFRTVLDYEIWKGEPG